MPILGNDFCECIFLLSNNFWKQKISLFPRVFCLLQCCQKVCRKSYQIYDKSPNMITLFCSQTIKAHSGDTNLASLIIICFSWQVFASLKRLYDLFFDNSFNKKFALHVGFILILWSSVVYVRILALVPTAYNNCSVEH